MYTRTHRYHVGQVPPYDCVHALIKYARTLYI